MLSVRFCIACLAMCAALANAQTPSDAASIRAARLAQNRAMAAGDADRAAAVWTDDVTLRRGLGQAVVGRDAYRALVASPMTDSSVVYQRTPTAVEVSTRWPLAFETGTWIGRRGAKGAVIISGKYSAQWVKRDTSWLIRSEVFVALRCAGVGCRSTYLAATPAPTLAIVDSVHVVDLLAREPMVVEHPSGTLFVSGYSDPVPHLWKSNDRGATWTRVNVGTQADGAVGNSDVDLAVAPDGTLYFVQMGFDRSVGEGTHVAIGVSTDVGATWKWTMLSRTRFDDRPWVEIARDGTAHVIWNDGRGVAHAVSRDGGATWTEEQRISDKGGSSHLALGPNREIAVRLVPIAASANTLDEGVDSIVVSVDGGSTWRRYAAPGARDWPSAANRRTTPRWVEPLAWDARGALYSFWTNTDGVWLARSFDASGTWTVWRLGDTGADARALPRTHEISYYPYLVARGDGQLAATWFSGIGESLRAHIARIDVGADGPRMVEAPAIRPESWGLSSRREDPQVRSSAGEYLAVTFLRDGGIAVVSPIQNERVQRFGFTWWRLDPRSP